MTAALLGLALLASSVFTVDDTYQAIQDASVNHGVAARTLHRIVSCETGHTYSPYAIGDHGTSLGAVQLHTPGELDRFYIQGYSDPYNPYEALDFLARAILAGRGSRWSCW